MLKYIFRNYFCSRLFKVISEARIRAELEHYEKFNYTVTTVQLHNENYNEKPKLLEFQKALEFSVKTLP